ncbi:hypothetical protein [Pseudaestuariivita rosea]|uniref:hypothetical protein n=1 Tax=Pseudaestuariivita rosea TaxID=2763263 RepID=UPI001ABB5D73|nr:hypothetical protein [Pseudaestuariivita rosea]
MIRKALDPIIVATMKGKNVSRKDATMRVAILFVIMGTACIAGYLFAPLDGITIGRRSSDVGLANLLLFLSVVLFALGGGGFYLYKNEPDES